MEAETFSIDEISWLNQFGPDRDTAAGLLGRVRSVTADEFQSKLIALILNRIDAGDTPVALYAERSIRKWKGEPNRLFKESGKPVRAFGSGPEPVKSENPNNHETGSEGIIANIITQITRLKPALAFNHPGPDTIRKEKIRRFILISDFIGSGSQAKRYLQAAWRIASVKSWHSGNFLEFEVVAFAAANAGVKNLENHPSQPKISFVEACPTIYDYLGFGDSAIIDLCKNYGPKNYETSVPRLGYSDIGALIVFSHGMPNNAPRLFFKKGRKWTPLFVGRVKGENSVGLGKDRNAQEKLKKMREERLSNLAASNECSPDQVLFLLVLTALKKRPRTPSSVSARTGLSIVECSEVLERCRTAGWVDEGSGLTPKALEELDYLRRPGSSKKPVPFSAATLYFPSQLRAPK
jgi:hypothetical protein